MRTGVVIFALIACSTTVSGAELSDCLDQATATYTECAANNPTIPGSQQCTDTYNAATAACYATYGQNSTEVDANQSSEPELPSEGTKDE